MPLYDALSALPNGEPSPWGDPKKISYEQRDVLLYAVGIGLTDLRFTYEGHPEYSVFPTFPIRWGGAGAPIYEQYIPKQTRGASSPHREAWGARIHANA